MIPYDQAQLSQSSISSTTHFEANTDASKSADASKCPECFECFSPFNPAYCFFPCQHLICKECAKHIISLDVFARNCPECHKPIMNFYGMKPQPRKPLESKVDCQVNGEVIQISDDEEASNVGICRQRVRRSPRVAKRPPCLEEARLEKKQLRSGFRVVEMSVRPHVRGNGIEVRGHYRFRLYHTK